MQFLDRVREITANFQDSHFQLDAVDPLSPVSLGFIVSNISGKYLVTSLRPKYLANQDVEVGDEVVSIDGKDPLTAANELKPYFPASSDLYRTNSVLFKLTSRDFALPTQATSTVVLRRKGMTISRNLPWGAASISRSDEATYLKNIKVSPAMQNLGLDTESLFSEDWRTNIGALKNRVDFADVSDPTTPVITVGTLDSASGPVAYLQIQTYMITAVSQIPGSNDLDQGSAISNILTTLENSAVKGLPDLPFVRTIKKELSKRKPLLPTNVGKIYKFSDFIDIVMSAFKAQSMPLILDVRYNPGGIIDDAISLVSSLASHNENIPPLSQMFRVTNLAWESVDAAVAAGTEDPAKLNPLAQEVASIFTDARAQGSAYSEVLPADPLTTNKVVNGYNQKIVVLTSSFCVSACDVTALLLKNAGRATLMGEPTNGTGAGFFSTFEVPDFTDTNHIIVAHLPNSLFGRPLKAGEDPRTIAVESIEAENHPTQPDVLVEPTLTDVQKLQLNNEIKRP
jgi:hypothetical protein